jgi:hypothetical protein
MDVFHKFYLEYQTESDAGFKTPEEIHDQVRANVSLTTETAVVATRSYVITLCRPMFVATMPKR